MEPINIAKFSKEIQNALARARKRTGLTIPELIEHLPVGQRSYLEWEKGGKRKDKSHLPTLKNLSLILQPLANLGLKKMRVEDVSDALIRNFQRCDPETQLFISLFAEVMAKDRARKE